MTEHSKISVPGEPDGPSESLIERAAARFDLNSLIARAAPPPSAPMRGPARAPIAPLADIPPVPRTEIAPPPTVEPVPVARVPARDAVTEAPPEPAVEPESAPPPFRADRYPIDREWLREQGLIVPEGTVTALLEEFRIVKRQLLVQAADLRRQKAGPMAQRVLVCSTPAKARLTARSIWR